MKMSLKKQIQRIPKWLIRIVLAFIGLIIIMFSNVYGDNKPFVIVSLFYFLFLFFLIIRWIFQQRRANINLKNEQAKTELQRIPKWVIRIGLVSMGLVIIIFNDVFGENEPFVIASLFYFLLLIFLIIRWIFQQIKSIIGLKSEQSKTELMHLKSQVNPHFFFNMLNNLYGLVGKDAKKAQELILKLSDMMRYSIYEGQKETVSLSEEVAYLQNYIALHKMRYHKTIDVDFQHDLDENDHQIMPLLFIILLENAFKHGVENLRENAFVHINLTAKNGEISFDIKNNFDASQIQEETGIGLENLKRRLELVYPKKHRLTNTTTKDVYQAHLTIKRV